MKVTLEIIMGIVMKLWHNDKNDSNINESNSNVNDND